MLCKIADLIAEVPAADGLDIRCRDYLFHESTAADIIIRSDLYRKGHYDPRLPQTTVAYMESAYQFYLELLRFDGFYLHASAVVRDGRAYLFSGHPKAGKSTHTRLWLDTFGDCCIINDDKPALRRLDGIWYAYGTPWCGKDGINHNKRAPLAGVCFLKKAEENRIRRLDAVEAMQKLLSQTIYKFTQVEQLDMLLQHLELFLQEVPVFELENKPESSAAQLSYETMDRCVREARQ